MPTLMRAVVQEAFGGPEVLTVAEVPRPEPLPTEVLVRVHAAGVNPVDWGTRAGGAFAGMLGTPLILGWEVSGVVEQVGRGVTRFAVGDEVYGMPRFPHQAGAYAEYVTAPSRHFARKPVNLTHVQAAGLALTGLTAWQSLVDDADVRAGQRVLIHAAAGGVGHLAVQIAKAMGAYVIGTARAAKHDTLRELGVDQAIDYTTTDVNTTVRDVDVAMELYGGGRNAVPVLKPGGMLVWVAGSPTPQVLTDAAAAGVRVTNPLVEPDGHGLAELTRLAEAAKLRVIVDTALPFEDAAKAHEIGQARRTTGKIVLTMAS